MRLSSGTDEASLRKRLFIVGKTDMVSTTGERFSEMTRHRFFHAVRCTACEGRRDLISKTSSLPRAGVDYRHSTVGMLCETGHGKSLPPGWPADLHLREYGGHEELDDEKLTLQVIGNQPNSGGGELTIGEAVPMSLYNEHPEYFPLVGGRRDDGENASKWMRRCLSNREVKQLVTEYVLRHLSFSGVYWFDYRDHSGGLVR